MKIKVYFRRHWFWGFKKWTREVFCDLGFIRIYAIWALGERKA